MFIFLYLSFDHPYRCQNNSWFTFHLLHVESKCSWRNVHMTVGPVFGDRCGWFPWPHYTSYQNINLQRPDPVGDKRSYVYGDKDSFLIYWEVEDWGRVTQKSRPNSPVRNTDGGSSPVKSPLVLSSKRSQRPTAKTPVPASWGNKQKIS